MKSIRVLQSFGISRPTTNPYITMLGDTLEATPGVDLLRFSWKKALFARYDVVHLHWPEALLAGRDRFRRAGKQLVFAAFLIRVHVARIPVVRTIHNLDQPAGLPWFANWLVAKSSRIARLNVAINPATPTTGSIPTVFIPHGHYIDWYSRMPKSESIPGRLAFTGLIRRYKGVEDLISAFAETAQSHPELSLSVTGKPSTAELAEEIDSLAAGDPRIRVTYGYVPEESLVESITAAQLVVLPYRFMHNSGSALAALSLARPVLLPRNDVNVLLRQEVGPGWVFLYDDYLTHSDLLDALQLVQSKSTRSSPNLCARNWDETGLKHVEAYRRALELRRDKRGKTRRLPAVTRKA